MIKIPITRDLAHEAFRMAEEIPFSIRNSIYKGDYRYIGCLGEAAMMQHFKNTGIKAEWSSTHNYDIVAAGKRLEVKTKRGEAIPQPDFECSVNDYNTNQDCDFYVFARALKDCVYIIGYISPQEFYDRGRFAKKGDLQPNKVNGKQFKYKADCYNVYAHELQKFK